jgi:hypothetical protein
MREARTIIRELQAIGARLERDGERLILRAGSHPIPRPLVHRARDAKDELLALLDGIGTLTCSGGADVSLTTKNTVSILGERGPESRDNPGHLLRRSDEHLSDRLSSHPLPLAEPTLVELKSFGGLRADQLDFNHRLLEQDSPISLRHSHQGRM